MYGEDENRKVRFMATATTTPRPFYLDALEPILTEIIAPAAGEIDRTAAYPQAALDALAQAGLLGLVSAKEVGGLGEGIRAATLFVEEIAKHCDLVDDKGSCAEFITQCSHLFFAHH